MVSPALRGEKRKNPKAARRFCSGKDSGSQGAREGDHPAHSRARGGPLLPRHSGGGPTAPAILAQGREGGTVRVPSLAVTKTATCLLPSPDLRGDPQEARW